MRAEERGRLPEGWASAELGDLLTFQYGKALPDRIRTGSGFPVYGSNGIVGRHDQALTQSETIIIGRKGSVGEINYSLGPCSPIDTTYFVDNLWAMPFKYWLHQLKYIDLESLNKATAIPGLNREDAYRVEISLPPLPEQIRIADKLDALLARVEAGRERLERVPKLVKAFRQAVLSAAVSGELTQEWRGSRQEIQAFDLEGTTVSVPVAWDMVRVKDLLNPMRPLCYGVVQPGDIASGGVPLIRVQDMERGAINVLDLRTVTTSVDEEYRRSRVQGGDLLISVVGTIGRTAVVPEGFKGNIARAVARLACESPVTSKWLNLWLSTDAVQWYLLSTSREVARKTLNLSDLSATPVTLPSLPEQAEIVRRVEALFALADRLEDRYQSALTSFDRLTPALLAKAFRGELVPQDPNDEPASVLLERIRAQRATEGSKPKRGRRAAPSSTEEPKRRGRPPKAQAEAGEQAPSAEAAAQTSDLQPPRRRGRPPKVRPEAQAPAPAAIPKASSYEDAVRKLEALKLKRAGGTRQVSLFDEEPQPG